MATEKVFVYMRHQCLVTVFFGCLGNIQLLLLLLLLAAAAAADATTT